MTKAIQSMFQRAEAEPFRTPVDWKALGLYDYPQIIKKPMDLATVKKNIADRKYPSLPHAAEDVRLVWTNCMSYNADGSDFFLLAKNLSKRWEEKYSKLVADYNLDANMGGAFDEANAASKISLSDKREFAKTLYKISKEDLGKILVEVDTKCPQALTKNAGEDECELNIDKLSPAVFQEMRQFVATCLDKGRGSKKKTAKRKSAG
eukprot:CAMPEP_0113617922 /NCGR_PEP_ID=MMETSP0017_2-20120614/9056_1 /TAXON_ID=2856 /ORGANISM="Cylindrotheca closterium" /LENGTH=205 /DNA_ID=CAMNT_0000527385 /DNA_START=222 /DNA_END=839 /DNA_ORIENTATION=+ /assembly_acc=CAM_ASM_000147